jgi:hypothetical protein
MPQRYCTNCGTQLGDEARFCPNCGRPVLETAAVSTPEADVPVPPPPQQQGAGQPNYAPAGAGTQAESRERNPVLMGCLVLAGIVVVLSIVGTCGGGSGGGGGDADKNPKQEQAAQKEDQEAQKEIEKAQQQAAEAEKEAKEAKEAQEAAEQEQQAEEERKAAEEQQRREEAAAARKKAAEAAAATAKIGETVRAGDAEWTVTYAWRTNVLRQKGFGQFGDSKQGNFVVMDFTFTNRASESVTLDSISLPLFDSQGREYEADTDTFGYIPAEKDIFLNQVNPGVTQEG